MINFSKNIFRGALLVLISAGAVSAHAAEPVSRYQAAKGVIRGRFVVSLDDRHHFLARAGTETESTKLVEVPVSRRDVPHAELLLFTRDQAVRAKTSMSKSGVSLRITPAEPEHFGINRDRHDPTSRQALHAGFDALVREYQAEMEEVEAAPVAK